MRAARVLETIERDGEIESWTAQHDGYASLDPPAIHRRTVRLDRQRRRFDIVDDIDTAGAHPMRLAFHIGPAVEVARVVGPGVDDDAPALTGRTQHPAVGAVQRHPRRVVRQHHRGRRGDGSQHLVGGVLGRDGRGLESRQGEGRGSSAPASSRWRRTRR